MNAFRQGMRELGYTEGQGFVIEPRYADGKAEVMPAQAAELERLGVDVIIASPFAVRNNGPHVMPDMASHALTQSTGRSLLPRGIGSSRPSPVCSVLLRRTVMRRPSGTSTKSETSSAHSSDRRRRLRTPGRLAPDCAAITLSGASFNIWPIKSAVAGALPCFNVPTARRMPRSVALTPSPLVGVSNPARRWRSAIAAADGAGLLSSIRERGQVGGD